MANDYLFTSESVSEGHPDKSRTRSRTWCWTRSSRRMRRVAFAIRDLVKTGVVIGRRRGHHDCWVDVEALVRRRCSTIGYNSSDMGSTAAVARAESHAANSLPTSPRGVDRKDERKAGSGRPGTHVRLRQQRDRRADAGADHARHRLVKRQAQVRKAGKLPWLRPTRRVRSRYAYEDDKPGGSRGGGAVHQTARKFRPSAARGGDGGDPQAHPAGEVGDKRTKYHINRPDVS